MTNEEFDLRLKLKIKPECLIEDPPPITDLIYPSFQRYPLNSPDTYSYNAPIEYGGHWYLYDQNRMLHVFSHDFSIRTRSVQSNAPAGSVIKVKDSDRATKFLGRQHFKSAFNSDYECKYYKSTDGVSWYPSFLDRQVQGEDANMIQIDSDPNRIINFIRPSRIRDIGVQSISLLNGKVTPSGIRSILLRRNEAPPKDLYCACPIVVDSNATVANCLVFVAKYRKGNMGQDSDQMPPYTTDEHTVDTYLYYYVGSTGEMFILNDGRPIIDREVLSLRPEQQLYIWATLFEENIVMNVSTSTSKHVISQPQILETRIYTWKLSDALAFVRKAGL